METRVEFVCPGMIEPGPPAHMSEHVSERLTPKQTKLARQTY